MKHQIRLLTGGALLLLAGVIQAQTSTAPMAPEPAPPGATAAAPALPAQVPGVTTPDTVAPGPGMKLARTR